MLPGSPNLSLTKMLFSTPIFIPGLGSLKSMTGVTNAMCMFTQVEIMSSSLRILNGG